MAENKLPKVLAISLSTWRKDSGIHTQTDLFKFWNPEKVAQIYLKSDLPNTPVCTRFFQIAENSIIKSVLNRKPVGREVQNGGEANAYEAKAAEAEKKMYAKAHKKKNWFMTVMREIVWSCGCWKTKALDISGKINHKRRNDDGGTVVQRLMRKTAEPLTDAKVQGNER